MIQHSITMLDFASGPCELDHILDDALSSRMSESGEERQAVLPGLMARCTFNCGSCQRRLYGQQDLTLMPMAVVLGFDRLPWRRDMQSARAATCLNATVTATGPYPVPRALMEPP